MDTPVYECRGKKEGLTYPCYAQLKLDGEYNVFVNGRLIGKYGKERVKLPVIEELEPLDADFIGELYWGDGKSGCLYQLLSHKQSPHLKYGVFDILRHKDKDTRHMPYSERRELLLGLFTQPMEHAHLIPSCLVSDRKHLEVAFDDATDEGYEGVVAKNLLGTLVSTRQRWVKMKYKITNDLRIVDIDRTRERIVVRVNDRRTCGVKCISKYKRVLRVGDIVEIEHQGVLAGNGLRHPVYIRHRPDKGEADTL